MHGFYYITPHTLEDIDDLLILKKFSDGSDVS